jgi:hypothetical protein
MELLGTIALVLVLVLVLVALLLSWYYWCSEGGFIGFYMAWNAIEMAGHVAALLLTVLASMFKSDS